MGQPEAQAHQSPYALVRAMRSTVGRESTTFGFSILVTAVFGLLQSVDGSPRPPQIIAYAMGAVMSFTLLEAVLSNGFRAPMPQHPTQTMALGTSLNFVSVGSGMAAAWGLSAMVIGWWVWAIAPFVAGVAYLLAESVEAALAERLLKQSGDDNADDVED